jgi:hypothetical protein
MLWPF